MQNISRWLLPLLLLHFPIYAGEKKAIDWKLDTETLSAPRGQTVTLKLHGEIPNGYYTYGAHAYMEDVAAAPTTFALTPAALAIIGGEIATETPKLKKDPLKGIDIKVYEHKVDFTLPLQIAADAAPGEHEVTLDIKYQICNEKLCLPGKAALKFTLKVADAPSLVNPLTGPTLLGAKAFKKKEEDVAWKFAAEAVSGGRGQRIEVKLQGKVPDGFYSYTAKPYPEGVPASPTQFSATPENIATISGVVEVQPTKKKQDPITEKEIEVLVGDVTFTLPLQIKADAAPGEHEITLKLDYQLCNERSCLPRDATLTFKLNISTAAALAPIEPAASGGSGSENSQASIKAAQQMGLWYYFWFSMAAGATALLTPCVFPMIPITVSFFTKRKQTSRARSIRDAGIYALGIIITFTLIGIVFAALFGATKINQFATNPIVNLLFAGLFVVLAMSLFGVFEIQLPVGLLNKLNHASGQGDGVVSLLLMGTVFSLTSFTCTVPFIGATLFSAAQGDWIWPLVGMLGFSTAFAAPFFLLALFPAALKSLPKSGGWLNSVKVVMGFLEIAAAMKFLSNVDLVWKLGILTREMFLSIWIALTVLVTFYLLGRFQFENDSPVDRVGGFRVLTASAFLSVGIWLGTGLTGGDLGELDAFLPPREYPGRVSKNHKAADGRESLTWTDNFEAALAESKKTGQPVFVDFTGYTCTNCRLMEERIFPTADVTAELKKFIRVRLYTDGTGDEAASSARNQQLQQDRYQTAALPLYGIIGPDGKDIAPPFEGLTRDPQEFVKFLKKATK